MIRRKMPVHSFEQEYGVWRKTTTGTENFIWPDGVDFVDISLIGAGGGGAAALQSYGGGGGAGGGFYGRIDRIQAGIGYGDSIPVTVGSRGLGGTTGNGANGSPSSCGAFLTCEGGFGGLRSDVNITRYNVPGRCGEVIVSSGVYAHLIGAENGGHPYIDAGRSGPGGNSFFGYGGWYGDKNSGHQPGGFGYGSGGAGGNYTGSSSTWGKGGPGCAGYALITWQKFIYTVD